MFVPDVFINRVTSIIRCYSCSQTDLSGWTSLKRDVAASQIKFSPQYRLVRSSWNVRKRVNGRVFDRHRFHFKPSGLQRWDKVTIGWLLDAWDLSAAQNVWNLGVTGEWKGEEEGDDIQGRGNAHRAVALNSFPITPETRHEAWKVSVTPCPFLCLTCRYFFYIFLISAFSCQHELEHEANAEQDWYFVTLNKL